MRASRLIAVALISAAWLAGVLRGAGPVVAQPKSDNLGCPSFHEVHPTITGKNALKTRVPVGYKIYPSDVEPNEPLLLRDTPIVSGGEIADAQADSDYLNEPVVAFRFNAAAKRRFADFTERNIGHSGRFTVAETERLAAKLNSGSCRPHS